MIFDAARVLLPFVISFVIGIAAAPVLTHYLFKYKAWKKKGGKGRGLGDANGTPLFDDLHRDREVSTPRMGGILIWTATLAAAALIWIFAALFGEPFDRFEFVDRGQTWLPIAALLFGGLIGLIDDLLEVTGGSFFTKPIPPISGAEVTPAEVRKSAGGLSLGWRLSFVAVAGAFAGWWFYSKLDVSAIGIPFVGPLELGALFVPFFVFVMLCIYASGVIDGIDGLAGGVFAIVFLAYAGIAFGQGQFSLAAFAATVAGAIFAFLWFNVPPARFYMSETGSMALTLALTVTAFSADVLGDGVGVAVLPIIALPLAATVLSNVLQVVWKKLFKKKLFKIAPIHHHFETMGWPPYKVTMRYWIIAIIAGIFGIAIALLK